MHLENIKLLFKNKLGIDLDIGSEKMDDIGKEGWIDSVLWQTAYVCHDYFISEELFGYRDTEEKKNTKEGKERENIKEVEESTGEKEEQESGDVKEGQESEDTKEGQEKKNPQINKYSAQNLIYISNDDFRFWLRKIILDNALFDIYINLGRKVNADKKINTVYDYFVGWERSGYYVLSEILKNEKKLNFNLYKEIEKSSKIEVKIDENVYKDRIKNVKRNSVWTEEWCIEWKNTLPESVKEYISEESVPMFDAMLINRFIRRGKKLLDHVWRMQDLLDDDNMNLLAKQINKLQFGKFDAFSKEKEKSVDVIANSGKEYDNLRRKQVKDQQIFDYEIELFLHGRLQIATTDLCVFLDKEYHIRMKALEKRLVETVKMGLRFGMEFLLNMPLIYIASPAITEKLNDREDLDRLMYVNKEEATSEWSRLYCEYLSELTYVTIPIIRTALEYNLRMAVKNKSGNSVDKILFDYVEQYVLENLSQWNELYASSKDLFYKKENRDYMSTLTERANGGEKNWYYIKSNDIKEYIKISKEMYVDRKGNKDTDNEGVQIQIDDKKGLKREFLQGIYPKWYKPEYFGQYRMRIIDQEYFSFISGQQIKGFEQETIEERKKDIAAYYGKSWEYEQKRY